MWLELLDLFDPSIRQVIPVGSYGAGFGFLFVVIDSVAVCVYDVSMWKQLLVGV